MKIFILIIKLYFTIDREHSVLCIKKMRKYKKRGICNNCFIYRTIKIYLCMKYKHPSKMFISVFKSVKTLKIFKNVHLRQKVKDEFLKKNNSMY